MNFISGKVMDSAHTKEQLKGLGVLIEKTYAGEALSSDKVIRACDALSQSLNDKVHLSLLTSLGMAPEKAQEELEAVRLMLSRGYLSARLDAELGDTAPKAFTPYNGKSQVMQEVKPLGVLFHIAAGNVDALPVFSVIEGLLAGNINILKLPGADNGLSIAVLQELISYEPLIADYVIVFDSPSQDVDAMKAMAQAADAIVVWGGDEAVRAVRQLAEPDTRIIEWGHKISFAYVSGDNVLDEDLESIAYNMCDTNGLFCSSCQGIYLDTDDFEEVCAFAQRFLRILEHEARSVPAVRDEFITAQKTLEIYTEELEGGDGKRVFKGEGCSVIAMSDSSLTPSYMYRNCWVKPLPKERMLAELLKYKNHLQTVALVSDDGERGYLERLLCKTGIVRITSGRNMSKSYCGMPHDGECSLSRYVKIVSYEYD